MTLVTIIMSSFYVQWPKCPNPITQWLSIPSWPPHFLHSPNQLFLIHMIKSPHISLYCNRFIIALSLHLLHRPIAPSPYRPIALSTYRCITISSFLLLRPVASPCRIIAICPWNRGKKVINFPYFISPTLTHVVPLCLPYLSRCCSSPSLLVAVAAGCRPCRPCFSWLFLSLPSLSLLVAGRPSLSLVVAACHLGSHSCWCWRLSPLVHVGAGRCCRLFVSVLVPDSSFLAISHELQPILRTQTNITP